MSTRHGDDGDAGWLERSLKDAAAEVATWPQWKKDAMRVISDPAVRPTEAGHGIETTLRVLLVLSPARRVAFFDALRAVYCLSCGQQLRGSCHCTNDE